MRTKYFEVYRHCERDIQGFMDEIGAIDKNLKITYQQFFYSGSLPPESSYVGFWYAETTRKHLRRLADFHQLQLVFVQPALSDIA